MLVCSKKLGPARRFYWRSRTQQSDKLDVAGCRAAAGLNEAMSIMMPARILIVLATLVDCALCFSTPSNMIMQFEARAPIEVDTAALLLMDLRGEAIAEDGSFWAGAFEAKASPSVLVLDSPAPSSLDAIRQAMAAPAEGSSNGPMMQQKQRPVAIGRLRKRAGGLVIDALTTSIAKEEPTHREALEVCIDSLVLRALQLCDSEEKEEEEEDASTPHFESLQVAADIHTRAIFEALGFIEIDDSEIDFAALASSGAIVTHCARLPSTILALRQRVDTATDAPLNRRVTWMTMLAELLKQAPLPSSEIIDSDGEEPPSGGRDPWASMRGFQSGL
jgi:hypothetical protein